MKNLLNRILCVILILCSFSLVTITGATGTSLEKKNNEDNTTPSPMASAIALDTNVTQSGSAWYQMNGYPSYRVWVENTTNYIMTVRITSPKGLTTTFLVPAGGSNKCISNNATEGVHELTFSTTGNVVSGTVRVRVSTMPLT